MFGFPKDEATVLGIHPAEHPYEVRQKTAYIPDQVHLYAPLTGLENLRYLATLAGVEDVGERISLSYLQSAGLPAEAAERKAGGYSKGMRQVVAVALALAKQAKVLLLDEPTTCLDPESIAEFGRLLRAMAEQRTATLMATHDLAFASEIGTRMGMMRGGRL